MKILNSLKISSKTALFFSSRAFFRSGRSLPPSFFSSPQIRFFYRKVKVDNLSQMFETMSHKDSSEEASLAVESLYEPKGKIPFTDGLCKIYENTGYSSSRNYLALLSLLVLYLMYRFGKKLKQHAHNRKLFRSLFYLLGLAGLVILLRSMLTFTIVVKSIELCEDGKHIILTHPRYLVLLSRRKFNISSIQRPLKVPEGDNSSLQFMEFGYPILIEDRFFSLPRSGEITNKELMPVILNGRYVKTEGNMTSTVNI